MIATEIVVEAARHDRNRFKVNPNGAGFLTRAERWSEVVRYCRHRDAQRAAELTAEYGPIVVPRTIYVI